MLLNNHWIKEEIKEEINNYLETNLKNHNFSKFMKCSKNSTKREVHRYTGLPQETKKIPSKQSNDT